jgi:hypothetical protein
MKFNRLKLNNRGSLTVDYMFAFVLVCGFCFAIIALSTSLTAVEVIQYTAYAAARRFYAGNIDPTSQQSAAARKLNALLSNPAVLPLVNGGWFQIIKNGVVIAPDVTQNYPQFADPSNGPYGSIVGGVVIPFNIKLLKFQLPPFGASTNQATQGSNGFLVNINSILGREPNFSECKAFWDGRWQAIQGLSNNQSAAAYSTVNSGGKYIEVIDNGC